MYSYVNMRSLLYIVQTLQAPALLGWYKSTPDMKCKDTAM